MGRRSSTPILKRASPGRTTSCTRRSSGSSASSSPLSECREPVSKPQLHRSDDDSGAFIRVVARVRPKLAHEARAVGGVEVDVGSHSLTLTPNASHRSSGKKFYVDHVFDSRQEQGSQDSVFSGFAMDFVHHSLNGYNVCMFAYGHTGSGKTYTMLGDQNSNGAGSQAGILPRFLHELFAAHALDPEQQMGRRYSCEFYEVYNEQIKDLLVPIKSRERTRKVHVHPKHGVRVENLTMSIVSSAEEALGLVDFGSKMRAVAATTMNARSSRSHAVFTFKYEQESCNAKSRRSMVTFVDLAGREDISASQNQATQFREMCCINTSLFHLAKVITKLSQGSIDGRSLADFRNSKLTLLLSPALIGNSKTALISTVSPLQSFFDDSLSTMNFAASVKKIKTCPVINNKNPTTVVSELEAEVKVLQSELAISKTGEAEKESALRSARALISSCKTSWEEALQKSKQSEMTRKKSLESLGLATQGDSEAQDVADNLIPFFTKLSDDPAMQGRCNYFFIGDTFELGSSEQDCAIVLQGLGILPQMCEVRVASCGNMVIELSSNSEGAVPRVLVDGYPLSPSGGACVISHGTCVVLGYSHAFRFVVPTHSMAVTVGSADACMLARSTLSKLDVTSAVGEIVDEAGEQFTGILPYISHLSTRVADDTVQSFLASLHRICPLIDEANLITNEVFEGEGLRFELHALTNVFNFGQDVPELVVCLSQRPGPLSKFRRSVQTVMHERRQSTDSLRPTPGEDGTSHLLGKAQHPLVHAMGLSEHMRIGGQTALLYVWSLEKFLWRLNAIREVYQEGSDAKDSFASKRVHLETNPDQNPWKEISSGDVQLLKERRSVTKYTIPVNGELRTRTRQVESHKNDSTRISSPSYGSQTSTNSPISSMGSASSNGSPMTVDFDFDLLAGIEQTHAPNEHSPQTMLLTPRWDSEVMQLQGRTWLTPRWGAVSDTAPEQPEQEPSPAVTLLRTNEAIMNGSEDITCWLSKVEELRDTLKQKLSKERKEPTGTLAAFATDVSQQVHKLGERYEELQELSRKMSQQTDVVKIAEKGLWHHLEALEVDDLIGSTSSCSTSSTAWCSEHCSECITPTDSIDSHDFTGGRLAQLRADALPSEFLASSAAVSGAEQIAPLPTLLDARRQGGDAKVSRPGLGTLKRTQDPTVDRPKPSPWQAQQSFPLSADASLEHPGQSRSSMMPDAAASVSTTAYHPTRQSLTPVLSSRNALHTSQSCVASILSERPRRHSVGPVLTACPPSAPTLLTKRHSDSLSQATSANASVNAATGPSVAVRPCTPSSSRMPSRSPTPSKRFVAYPKITWAYYEVPDNL